MLSKWGCVLRKILKYGAFLPALMLGVQVASAGEYGSLKDSPAVTESYNWSGFYAGAHVGYAWGNDTVNDNVKDWCAPGDKACIKDYVGPFSFSPDGVFGGGTIGYNYQFDRILVGIEGDLGYMDLNGENDEAKSSAAPFHQSITLDGGLYGDITGRLGFLVTPATLVYGKGGFAFYDGEGEKTTPKPGYASSGTDTFTGAVYGGGIEHMLTENVSVKIEYLHFDFGDEDSHQTALVADYPTPKGYVFQNHHDLDADSVKAGIAYHF